MRSPRQVGVCIFLHSCRSVSGDRAYAQLAIRPRFSPLPPCAVDLYEQQMDSANAPGQKQTSLRLLGASGAQLGVVSHI